MFESIGILTVCVIGILCIGTLLWLVGDRADLRRRMDSAEYSHTLLKAQSEMTHTKVVTLEQRANNVSASMEKLKFSDMAEFQRKFETLAKESNLMIQALAERLTEVQSLCAQKSVVDLSPVWNKIEDIDERLGVVVAKLTPAEIPVTAVADKRKYAS